MSNRKKRRVSSAGIGTSAAALPSGDGGADRLTELPDFLRLYILTFLPLKFAIRTGALSTQWRDLWKQRWSHGAFLDLSSSSSSAGADDSKNFVEHVDRLLSLHGRRRKLDALQIRFHPDASHLHKINDWLHQAFDCGVEALSLDFSPPPPAASGARRRMQSMYRFYFAPYSKGALDHLTLTGLRLIGSPPSYFRMFSFLEALNLYNVGISDFALKRVLSALLCLRVLDLRWCPMLRVLVVRAPRITSLILVDCPKVIDLSVSSPYLRSLHCSSGILKKYSLSNALALEDVYMSRGDPMAGLPPSKWVAEFGGLLHVRVLTLCSLSLQYIAVSGASEIGEFQCFWNLRELQLLMLMMTDGNLMDIYSFFRLCHCPVLEKLFIELPTCMRNPFMEVFLEMAEEEPPEGCFKNLKNVKINNFKGQCNEMQLVRFLLLNAARLESLVIIAPEKHFREEHNINGEIEYSAVLLFFRAQLLLIPKASAAAQISLIEQDDNQLLPTHSQGYWKHDDACERTQ